MGDRVAAWATEEEHHGRALRRWLAMADPSFDVDAALARFVSLPYHEGEDEPRRGGAAHELVSRCVVEALASGFYAALAGAADEPLLRQICLRLMDDERRHLRQFAAMRDSLPTLPRSVRLRVAADRIRELGDDQIAFAAHCADEAGRYRRGRARRRHRACVWPLYDTTAVTHCLALLAEAAGTQRTSPPRPVRIPLVLPLAWPTGLALRSVARLI